MIPSTFLAQPDVNTDGIVEWGVKNIIPILLLVVGISIIASARKGRMSENEGTISNVMLGCIVIAGAAFLRVRRGHREPHLRGQLGDVAAPG